MFYMKYKYWATEQEISRVIEIIKNGKLYWPTCKQLNDPFEGILGMDEISGWAGK